MQEITHIKHGKTEMQVSFFKVWCLALECVCRGGGSGFPAQHPDLRVQLSYSVIMEEANKHAGKCPNV